MKSVGLSGRTAVGVTGHQGLPDGVAEFVRGRLRRLFPHPESIQVICSLAEGADQLIADWFTEAGALLAVVVPSRHYESTFQSPEAQAEYERLLARASVVHTLSFAEPSEDAFQSAGYLVVDEADRIVAVWDGKPARGKGGTADVVQRARDLQKPIDILWPAGVERQSALH